MTDYIAQAIREVEEEYGIKSRSFPNGTRAATLKHERMAVLSKAVKSAKADGNYRVVTTAPVDMELIVRGGKPDGKLD